jgi:hypothetical protein
MKHHAKGLELLLVFATLLLLLSSTACGTADCAWWNEAEAWVDENQNGVWDDGEKPLAGVQFIIDDIRNNLQDVGEEAISGEDGKAALSVWLPGCPTVEFEISAKPPDGFQATTPDRVPVSKQAIRKAGEVVFSFGFVARSARDSVPTED